ncbi:dihydrodipicolinate reductase [Mycobacterium sp. SMC-15]|uniref:NAD(P)H-dependent amine dehydrogenase family protein n=1 Tax=Mycobacterium sp. SMC-15 TaxID=3381627 RepID=UPI003876B7FD
MVHSPASPYRVVQWTTGNVGRSSVRAIAGNPNYDLVGLFAWSDDKVGRDAGELAGIDPLGVTATNDAAALLALKPDCVVYNPMWINVDELVQILSAGVNVVTSASFITGHNLGDDRARLDEACRKGGSTLFGSGVSPGFAELLAIVAATACDRVDKITITETADTTLYDSPDTERPVGFGAAIDDPDLEPMAARGTAVFAEAVRLVADAMGVELDEITCSCEYAQTTTDLSMASWTIPAGHVAGVFASWQGIVNGQCVIDINVRWRKGQTLEPDWQLDGDGWKITIDGRPTVNMQVGFTPPPDLIATAKSLDDFFELGHIMTAIPPINAIPAVVAAEPGIATYNDLPLNLPRFPAQNR